MNEHRDEEGLADNERLEFLGDAVIDLAVSHRLMERFPTAREGDLSKMRAAVVDEQGLSEMARALDLGSLLRLGRGEELTGGRRKASLLADAMEAVIAAVYLGDGLAPVLRLVDRFLGEAFARAAAGTLDRDFKTQLQELAQSRLRATPRYRVVAEHGPDHSKTFEVETDLRGEVVGGGAGRSKKDAEQAAAKLGLDAARAPVRRGGRRSRGQPSIRPRPPQGTPERAPRPSPRPGRRPPAARDGRAARARRVRAAGETPAAAETSSQEAESQGRPPPSRRASPHPRSGRANRGAREGAQAPREGTPNEPARGSLAASEGEGGAAALPFHLLARGPATSIRPHMTIRTVLPPRRSRRRSPRPRRSRTPPEKKKTDDAGLATFKTSRGEIVVQAPPARRRRRPSRTSYGLAQGTKAWTDPRAARQVKKPLYDGTLFHRVIPQFMIQGGDPLGPARRTARRGARLQVRRRDRPPDNQFTKAGQLAMANTGPNTNGSQFFITEVATPWLDRGHTIFGEVVKGFDLVPKIVAAGNGKVKLDKVIITRGAQP